MWDVKTRKVEAIHQLSLYFLLTMWDVKKNCTSFTSALGSFSINYVGCKEEYLQLDKVVHMDFLLTMWDVKLLIQRQHFLLEMHFLLTMWDVKTNCDFKASKRTLIFY